jgi:DNA-binding NtrC family response regulator
MRCLQGYAWPGNVRELRNLVERHVVLAEAPLMHLDSDEFEQESDSLAAIGNDLPTLQELERRYIFKVLTHCRDSRAEAARLLGIDKSTLWRKLQQYGGSDPGNA